MQNLYPLFEGYRVLKKEALWSLRDYSFSHIRLEYQEYGQGFLMGCRIRVEGEQLIIGTGMIKYGSFVCLLLEETKMHVEPADQVQYLKARVELDRSSPDFAVYETEFFLNTIEEKKENEFELCRFHLSPGARLRNQYKDFFDMGTEYDTINHIYGDWGGIGGGALAPEITRFFGQQLLHSESALPEDLSFAYHCLSASGAIPRDVINGYIRRRLTNQAEFDETAVGNEKLYGFLSAILDRVRRGGEKSVRKVRERHRILVD